MYANEKKEYVKVLGKALSPMRDFGGIDYAAEYYTGAEYIKVWDIIGAVQFLDVTGYKLDVILRDIATLVLGEVPNSVVTDIAVKREIAKLFAVK